ncbi:expressed unknown protein [Seminavis robusta]|uniref:Uncharacterized protein n=1 Tax=Seminavis robusta TaxID=568900 RepID=A0A9N8HLA2_9STRA|nr:expressed unknown protein [Seminavis robusta]|eukprot:Sro795_g203540.1 n/a (171) ;mRNA; r:30342-30854
MESPTTTSSSAARHDSPVIKKRQHQLRALLFNRLGLLDAPFTAEDEPSSKQTTMPEPEHGHCSQACSQQYLKGGEAKKRGGLIRFDSIVSVVTIPRYSNSMRNLLWGKKNKSSRFDDDYSEELDSTAGTQDDPVVPSPKTIPPKAKSTTNKSNPKMAGRHRLMRKKSFHS